MTIANKERCKKYYAKNKLKLKKKAKKYYYDNKDKVKSDQKEYQSLNKNKLSAYNKLYYEENKEDLRKYQNNWVKEKSKIDPCFRLRRLTSRSINNALKSKGFSKAGQSITIKLSYTIKELKEHLEKQFEPWMTWNNHGVYKKKEYNEDNKSTWTWHIDHIIPVSTFNFQSMEDDEFIKCWALDNLQPLKSIDNIKKRDKLQCL